VAGSGWSADNTDRVVLTPGAFPLGSLLIQLTLWSSWLSHGGAVAKETVAVWIGTLT